MEINLFIRNMTMKKILWVLLILSFVIFQFNLYAQTELVEEECEVSSEKEIVLNKDLAFDTKITSAIDADKTQVGDSVDFKLIANYVIDEEIIFNQNSLFNGTIIEIIKEDLLGDKYKVSIEITSLTTPFGKKYDLKAHPELNLDKRNKNKGRRFKIGVTQTGQDDLADRVLDEEIKPDDPKTLLIKLGKKIKVVLDEDLTLITK